MLDIPCSPYLIWFFLINQSFLSWLLQVNCRNALKNIMKFRKFLTLQQYDFNCCHNIRFSSAFLQFTCKSHDRKLWLIRKNQIKYGEQGRSSIMMLCNCLQNSNIFPKNCRNPQGSEFNLRIFLKILFALRFKTSVCSKVRRLQHRRA